MSRRVWSAWVFGGAALLVVFLVLPLAALPLGMSFGELTHGLAHPLAAAALRLSLLTTFVSLALVVALGLPLAWLLSRSQGRLARAIETLIELPMVLPPAVAGVALLLAYGRRGALGGLWGEHLSIAFSPAAVVLAQVFVSAPFFVRSGTAAFRRLDEDLLRVARSFGASPARVFFRIALPLAAPGLLTGAAMSWARSLGEFGATLMFAGSNIGRTQTLPLAIYAALETELDAARALSVLLLVVAFLLLVAARVVDRATLAGARGGGD